MEQLDLPFALDQAKLKTFLRDWCAIEDLEDDLRARKRLLKESHQDAMPMRAVLTAVKIVRAREKLINHPKEPMERVHFAILETLVEQRLLGLTAMAEAIIAQAQARQEPGDMTTGEVGEDG